jgi:hypothetical protein
LLSCLRYFQQLWNPKLHYRVHMSQPLVLINTQRNPALPSYFVKIRFNIILRSGFESFQWHLSSYQNSVCSCLPCVPHALSHPSCYDRSSNIWRGIQIMALIIMRASSAFCHFTHLRYRYSPQRPLLRCLQTVSFP